MLNCYQDNMMSATQPQLSPTPITASKVNPPSGQHHHFVVFRIDQMHYALPLENVTRILRMVAITPMPDAAEHVMGVINIAGQTVPVIDLRSVLKHPLRAADINDRLLIFKTAGQSAALMVDDVLNILELLPAQMEQPDRILAQSRLVRATVQQTEGAVLLLDVENLLPV